MNILVLIYVYVVAFIQWIHEMLTTVYLCRLNVERDDTGHKRLFIYFAGRKALTDYEECRLGCGFLLKGTYLSNKKEDLSIPVVIDNNFN